MYSHNGSYFRWYNSLPGKQIYIKKKDTSLLDALAQKKYLSYLYEDTLQQKKATEAYLNIYNPKNNKAEHLLDETSLYYPLLSTHFQSTNSEFQEWISTPYEHCTNYTEQLIHKSCSGNMVRSKSEAIIDMALYIHKIPFRYECALHIGDITFYPDFTIRHPITGKIFYWEHLGLMDTPSYIQNTYSKLQVYNLNGIIQSINLITTYETKDYPLNSYTVEKKIQEYFL